MLTQTDAQVIHGVCLMRSFLYPLIPNSNQYQYSPNNGEFVRKNKSFIILVLRNASQSLHAITEETI